MFCPNCHYEYLPGVTNCPDCGEPLVAQLLPESVGGKINQEPPELITVYVTSDLSLIAAAKSMMGEAGIAYEVKGEQRLYYYPLSSAEIQVDINRSMEAQDLLKDLEKSEIMPGQNPFDEGKEP